MKKKLLAAVSALALTIAQAHAAAPILKQTDGGTGAVDRMTVGNVLLDVRYDLAMACDGVTLDTAAFLTALNTYKGTATPVTFVFSQPKMCLIDPVALGLVAITGKLNFLGVNGGGLLLTPAAPLVSSIFTWTTSGRISIKDFTLDLNGAVPTALTPRKTFAAMQFNTGIDLKFRNSRVIRGGVVTAGAGLVEIAGYGLASCEIEHSEFSFIGTSSFFNQTLNLGADSSLVGTNNCNIHNNTHVNSGIEYITGTNFDIHDENISGVGFGACVGNGSGFLPAVTVVGRIHHINCRNTLNVLDENLTKLNGIQEWNNGVAIDNNTIDGTCAQSILIGGLSYLGNNTLLHAGNCPGMSVFSASRIGLITTANTSPAGSVIWGTSGGDDGITKYCISDTISVGPYTIGPNNCGGTQGAYNVTGQGTFSNPIADNRVINPCFQVDQRHAGAVQSSTGGGSATAPLWAADQWHYAQSFAAFTWQIINSARSVRRCQFAEDVVISTQRIPAAADIYQLFQNIPISSLGDLAYGSKTARSILLGFCLLTDATPPVTLPWAIRNMAANTVFVGTFVFAPTTGNEQCFSFIIPGDQINFIFGVATASGMRVIFDQGSGVNLQAPTLSQWISGTYTTAAGVFQQNQGTVGGKFIYSDVRLQVVGADQGWSPPRLSSVMQDVAPYYQTNFPTGVAPASGLNSTNGVLCSISSINGAMPSLSVQFSSPMVTIPQIGASVGVSLFNPSSNANSSWYNETGLVDVAMNAPVGLIGARGFVLAAISALAQGNQLCGYWAADAGL